MRIIPAIDILNGKCVRLQNGDYSTAKIYNENPLEVAKNFESYGIKYLHLVDLDGAKSKQIINYKILNEITTKTNLIVDFGGGIKSNEDIKIAFDNGASKITGGSIAVYDQDLFINWINKYGADKIILGADCLNRTIAINGWLSKTDFDVVDFIEFYQSKGIEYAICTDISKDGTLEGPALDLYIDIMNKTKIKLIASGGVSDLQDLINLKDLGCEAAIIGKAIYEGRISLNELMDFN